MIRVNRTWLVPGRAAATLLCLWGLPLSAAAETVAVFPVAPAGGRIDEEQLRELGDALREELEQRRGISVIAVDWPASGSRRRARGGGARAELREGKRLSERLRIPQAIAKLERGLEMYRAQPEQLSNFAVVVDAHLLLAEAYLRRGKEAQGREVLTALARIQPWLDIDESRYPPLFVNLWKEIQSSELQKARGALRVDGASGTVWINGKELGSTPLRVDQLIIGEHHVVVRGQGGVFGKTVSVREQREVQVTVELVGSGGALGLADELAVNRSSEGGRIQALRAAEASGARYALLAAMSRGDNVLDLGLLLGDSVTGEWTRLRPLVLDTELLSTSIEANKAAREVERLLEQPGAPLSGTVAIVEGQGPVSPSSDSGELRTVSFYGAPAGSPARALDPRSQAPVDSVIARGDEIPPPTEVVASKEEKPGSIAGEWWFWTAVGVVALGAAGGAYFGFFHDRSVDGVSVEAVW